VQYCSKVLKLGYNGQKQVLDKINLKLAFVPIYRKKPELDYTPIYCSDKDLTAPAIIGL
jgi:hypothetical protein